MIDFVVYGEPHGKGRPRFRKAGNYVQTYTDKETASYENLVKLSYLNKCDIKYMNNEPLQCVLNIYQSIPKSTSKKKKEQMLNKEIYPSKKPDIDNIVKSIFDGLNNVAFNDDTQIIELHCFKYYGEEPRTEIKIWEVNNE